MNTSFEVVDRSGRLFVARVSYSGADGRYPWMAQLWDRGQVRQSVSGISHSKTAIERCVKAAVLDHLVMPKVLAW